MADYVELRDEIVEDHYQVEKKSRTDRVASLDVFRGLSVFLMTFVDYAGPLLPSIGHSPWNGVHLADCVMPFFLFIVGVSLALVYKNVENRLQATYKAFLKALQLFILGMFLQDDMLLVIMLGDHTCQDKEIGGYFHGITSLTYGVDMESIRWLGILQRISLCYIVAALCEIWLPCRLRSDPMIFKRYYLIWCVVLALCIMYSGLLYGLYVSDWQFQVSNLTSSIFSQNNTCVVYTVKCATRGDLGPACNSAGMIDRYILGFSHMYKKPVYKNLKECINFENGQGSESQPPWCLAPFDPEGILSSITASVTCIIGLHYGHILVQLKEHKSRLLQWLIISLSLFSLGLIMTYAGNPLNKSLYTISYMLLTSALAGITFCALYLLVDICGYKRLTFVLEWMGIHALGIYVLVTSNLAVIMIQGFYWTSPKNNIINWIVARFVHK